MNFFPPARSLARATIRPLAPSARRRIARLAAAAGWAAAVCAATAAPRITEFMAQNNSTLADEDGTFSDWIEIHNPDNAPVDLTGWHLTDRADDPTKWAFPQTALGPGGYLVVFASNKNRRTPGQPLHTNFALAADGEYLGLIAPDGVTVAAEFAPFYPPQSPDISYGTAMPGTWVRLAGKGDRVRVLVPDETSGPGLGTTWRERAFDDASWTAGTLAVGFKVGANDPLGMREIFETDVQALMYNLPDRLSVYLRAPFDIGNPADVLDLELRTQYDDGYAAFLNGGAFAVDSANAPGSLEWLSGATEIEFDHNGLSMRVSTLNAYLDRLVPGENILAIHGFNANQTSSDLLVAPQVWARVADAASPPLVGYFAQPSPGEPNPGPEGMILFAEPTFSEPSRTFSGSITVELGGAGPGQVIRYTTNGSVPQPSSPLYTAPLVRTATTTLRARIFDAEGIGSPPRSSHYLRLAGDLANRRSNLPMVVLDARGQALNRTTRVPAFFHLFDRDESGVSALDRVPDLATRQGLRWRGSSSFYQDKKPYSVEFWDDYDQDLRHPLLGMTEEADWVFYPPYHFDRAYIRNSAAYEMSRRAGRWASASRFVEVFYNANGGDLAAADYVGVYAIIEQIKMNTRRLGFRTVEPTDIPPDAPIDVRAAGRWTGGYLFKIDRTDPDEYNWKTERGIPSIVWLTLNRPKLPDLDGGPYFSNSAAENGSRQIAYLRALVQAFENALYADRAAGFAQRAHLDFIDRRSWVDHLVLNVFTKNVDAFRLSGFFHKPQDRPIIAGPVWDFDRSMDSYDDRDDAFDTWNGTGDATRYFSHDWWGVLAQDPDFVQAFYDRWAELRQGPFSNDGLADIILPMGAEIDDSANGLGSAAQRDAARWPANAPRPGGYPAEVQHVLTWMRNRAAWMDRRRTDGGTLPAPPGIIPEEDPLPAGGAVTLAAAAGTVYYRLDGGDPRAAGGGIDGMPYSGRIIINGPSTLIARARSADGHWSTPAAMTFLAPNPGPLFLPGGTADWTVNANWESNPAPYPDGPGAAAVVGPPGGETARNVELRAPVTIGRLSFPQDASTVRNRVRDRGEGNTLTFDNDGLPARLEVGGGGTGYVEFEVVAGTILDCSLELDVSNLGGDPEHGALRLRQGWTGPGGLVKQGPGIASLTGENKLYQGPTVVEEGVLRVTQPSSMVQSAYVSVDDGGQLRLSSASSGGEPRVYAFGGDLVLRGQGRGAEIPEDGGFGRLGALRYDPGTQDNHAILTAAVEMAEAADIHVDGSRNLLELEGLLRGPGPLTKTGGGVLALTAPSPEYLGPVLASNGTIRVRTEIGAPFHVDAAATLDVAGSTGPLDGAGGLLLPATALRAPSLSGLQRALLFTRPGPPDAANEAASGNAVIVTSNPGNALSLDIHIDDAPEPGARYQGGYLLPFSVSWSGVLDSANLRVYVADPAGEHEFLGLSWTESSAAAVTRVPATLDTVDGPADGRILEIRFDDEPLTYEAWRAVQFPDPDDFADPDISGLMALPTGDGIPNLVRFAFKLPARGAARAAMPRLERLGDGWALSFPYDPGLRGLRWIVETTVDIADWTDAEALFDSSIDPLLPDAGGRLLLALPDSPEMRRRFFRLRLIADAND